MFDDDFESGTSSDIDAFLVDLSRFSEQFGFDIDEVSYQMRENAENNADMRELQYDWLNDDIVNPDIQKEIYPNEFLNYLDYSRAMIFYNSNGDPVIKLIPADPNIVMMAKILSNRFKDVKVSQNLFVYAR